MNRARSTTDARGGMKERSSQIIRTSVTSVVLMPSRASTTAGCRLIPGSFAEPVVYSPAWPDAARTSPNAR
jgi:hypothetical protein